MVSIEKDIHQTKPFVNEYLKAVVNIQYTNSWVLAQLNQLLREFDVTPQQYNILRILAGCKEPVTVLYIKQRMLDQMSDASRIVERLVIKKLVSKTISTIDKRLVDVRISNEGLLLLQEMNLIVNRFNNSFSGLSKKEAETLNKLLDKLRESKD